MVRELTLFYCRNMDAALKELTKLEKFTDPNSKDPSIHHALNNLLQVLADGKAALLNGKCSDDCFKQLATAVDMKKKEIDERQKEIYNILSRLGKALDKVFHRTQNHCIDPIVHHARNFRRHYLLMSHSSRLIHQSLHSNALLYCTY